MSPLTGIDGGNGDIAVKFATGTVVREHWCVAVVVETLGIHGAKCCRVTKWLRGRYHIDEMVDRCELSSEKRGRGTYHSRLEAWSDACDYLKTYPGCVAIPDGGTWSIRAVHVRVVRREKMSPKGPPAFMTSRDLRQGEPLWVHEPTGHLVDVACNRAATKYGKY